MRGTCLCGTVAFDVSVPIKKLYQCYCSLCRKQSGSASNTATFVRSQDLKWISGRECISKWARTTGFSSHFCSTCGSPVPNTFKIGNSSFWWVPAGLFGNDLDAQIVVHIFSDSKASWSEHPNVLSSYGGMPDFNQFFEILHPSTSSD